MANKVLAGISFALCLIALGMTCGAMEAPNWTNFEESDSHTIEYGLWAISDDDDDNDDAADSKG